MFIFYVDGEEKNNAGDYIDYYRDYYSDYLTELGPGKCTVHRLSSVAGSRKKWPGFSNQSFIK